jgi:hypothetical protein
VLYADIVNGGNSRVASAGDPVIQPGLIDVNCNANGSLNIGTLVSNGGSLPMGGNAVGGIALVTRAGGRNRRHPERRHLRLRRSTPALASR